MKVAYAYELDASDIGVQSGHPFSILQQLQMRGEVQPIFPLSDRARYLFAPKYLAHRLSSRIYRPEREPAVLKAFARQVERELGRSNADWIFSPGSPAITYVRSERPIVFCADATFANMVGFYESFSNLSSEYLAQGHAQEARAIANASAAVYPSDWAAQSAVRDYGADPAKVHLIPFGGNVNAPSRAAVEAAVRARPATPLKLLFIGREWERKGGDIVVEAAKTLHRGGLEVELALVGLTAPPADLPSFVTNHGLLSKADEAQRARIEDLLLQSHFLFVPSRAEAYGMVFCEAAAFGLPSVSTDVGGIPTMVRNGQTGALLSRDSSAGAYADAIAQMFEDISSYQGLCMRARDVYDRELNWAAFADRLVDLAERLVT